MNVYMYMYLCIQRAFQMFNPFPEKFLDVIYWYEYVIMIVNQK